MLARVTLDKMNERYAGIYYSPRPSELPDPELVGATPLTSKTGKGASSGNLISQKAKRARQ